MSKHKKIDSNDIINPDFVTSTYYGKQSLTENELISKLEGDYSIYRKFIAHGYIISKEFSFITRATFDEEMISELDYKLHGAKDSNQKEQAIKMRKIVEDYINSLEPSKTVKVAFASRSDQECALYDDSRFENREIKSKLIEAFM